MCGNETHPGVWTLRGFTHDLHDEVSLRLQRESASVRYKDAGPCNGERGERSTSLSKLALVNSSELRSALVAASLTLLLGSSFLMPWMMAVRIWLALSWRCSGSCQSKVNQTEARKHSECVLDGTHDVLADVSDGLQRGLLHVLGAAGVCDVGHQLRDELGPLIDGDLGAGDASHTLRGRAGPIRLCSQSLQYLHRTQTHKPSSK